MILKKNIYKKIYGLTGIMGSGKSTAANIFQKYGAIIISADEIAKQVMNSNYDKFDRVIRKIDKQLEPHAIKKINKIIFDKTEKKINRNVLAELVFSDPKLLKCLNRIIHPEVRRVLKKKLNTLPTSKIIIYDSPLLFETGLHRKVKKTIVVYAPPEIAVERIHKRIGIPKEDIYKRLNTQISIEKKIKSADHVIENVKDFQFLKKQIEKVWRKIYLK